MNKLTYVLISIFLISLTSIVWGDALPQNPITLLVQPEIQKIIDGKITLDRNATEYLNETIRQIQGMLAKINTSNIFDTPTFNETLAQSVATFQQNYMQLSPDDPKLGKIDAVTMKRLIAIAALHHNPIALGFYGKGVSFNHIKAGTAILAPQEDYPQDLITEIQNRFLSLTDSTGNKLYKKEQFTPGIYDAKMKLVVGDFQRKFMNISPSSWAYGFFGAATLSVLEYITLQKIDKVPVYSGDFHTRDIENGYAFLTVEGGPYPKPLIQEIQKYLLLIRQKDKNLAYNRSDFQDGIYDYACRNAVAAFQRRYTVTSDYAGVVGKATWKRLKEVSTK